MGPTSSDWFVRQTVAPSAASVNKFAPQTRAQLLGDLFTRFDEVHLFDAVIVKFRRLRTMT
jgi:hypothetical protein